MVVKDSTKNPWVYVIMSVSVHVCMHSFLCFIIITRGHVGLLRGLLMAVMSTV